MINEPPPQPGADISDPKPADSPPSPAELLAALANPADSARLEAVKQLAGLEPNDEQALRALEQTAGQDASQPVREAALAALNAPGYRRLQQRLNHLPLSMRRALLTEISRWQTDGLISDPTADLLRQRYQFDQPPTQTAAAAVPAGPRPTLSQLLLSETTIKVALYLGGFFVISAAFILAAIIEFLRLPILGLTTIGFLGGALVSKPRLPQASFILFIVFSFLLPIDAGVLRDTLNLEGSAARVYWIVVTLSLSLVWMGGLVLYRSRFFSLLAPLAAASAMLQLGRWLDLSPHLDLLLIQLVTLLALGGAFSLARWQDRRFALPLLGVAQLQQGGVLAASALIVGITYLDQDWPASGWWLAIALTWLLGSLFYVLSHHYSRWALFPPLAVAALAPAPLLASGLISPSFLTVMSLAWGWAVVLALIGEGLGHLTRPMLVSYGPYLLSASALLFALAAAGGLWDRVAVGFGYLVGASLLYTGLTFYRPRGLLWTGALLAAVAAYFAFFFLPWLAEYEFYPGFVMLWPTLILASMNLLARRLFHAGRRWSLPPLMLGIGLGGLTLLALLATGFDEPTRAAIALAIAALYLAAVAILEQRPWLGYGATASLALSLGYILVWLEVDTWVPPLVGLALLYFCSGLALHYWRRLAGWPEMLRWSGLALGALVSLTAPLQGGATAVLGMALVATAVAVEAFHRRNVWLALPANLLYLGAYFTLLFELEVSQPQLYSIGAALLGFVMHYLLVRSGSRWGAFLTGLLSQLILLGTTYIQMFATERFLFFLVLFLQSLVVLVYGLVVRSKSLVIAPLVFVVLGVITVALSVLAGIPALILVGCTGLLLLLLGIAALLLRERLLKLTNQLGDRLGGWQA